MKTSKLFKLALAIGCVLGLTSSPAQAAVLRSPITTVTLLRSTNAGQDYFYLSGVTTLGTCGGDTGGVIFYIPAAANGDRMFEALLFARQNNMRVKVKLDDAAKVGTYCQVDYVDFYPPL